ncbi:MAG: transcriptional regulator [Candidatus Melainabacteria bacterium]|jgi:DNA-binding transcriptional ArsR family regulator|nr:MAG: transcriptional regulator [Candidatus Melainabacteria bacterium]
MDEPDKCCSPKPLLEDRPVFSLNQAAELAELFKLLADATRVRLLQLLLKHGEMRVSEISGALEMTPQAVSNQLQKLAYNNVVAARRAGVNIHYRVVDPCVRELLQQGMCLLEDARQSRNHADVV